METQEKLNNFFELLVERGRRTHQECLPEEIQELVGYILILSPDKDLYNHLIEGDEEELNIPRTMAKFLIDDSSDNKCEVLDAIRLSANNMFKEYIDKMFADYPYFLTNDHLLDRAQQQHDSYKEL